MTTTPHTGQVTTTTNAFGRTRTWVLPTAEARQAFAHAVLTAPTSLLPGLTALEAAAATRYAKGLPGQELSIIDAWAALPEARRVAEIAAARSELSL